MLFNDVNGRLVIDPSAEPHLYIDQYDLDLKGFSRHETTYFFLPSHVELNEVSQSESIYKIIKRDGSEWSQPIIDITEPILIDDGSNTPTPWNICFLKSENLHSIFIDTKERGIQSVSHEEYLPVSVKIYSPSGSLSYNDDSLLKGRGNATWNDSFDEKNPFQLKLDSSSSLCGLEPSDKWALLANYYDASKILNKMAYDIGIKLDLDYSTDSDWVDLYSDGEYLGNYLLCKEPDEYINGIDQYLIEKNDIYFENKPYGFKTAHDAFSLKSPSNPTAAQIQYIQDFVNKVDKELYSHASCPPTAIDIDSFAKWFLIEEVFFNPDALISSCYFNIPENGLLHAGPLWDFDSSMGEDGGYWLDSKGTILKEPELRYPNGLEWYNLLYDEQQFKTKVTECLMDGLPVFNELLRHGIDDYYNRIAASLRMDNIVWERRGSHASTVPGYYNEPYSNFRFIKSFLYKRLCYLANSYQINAYVFEPNASSGQPHQVSFIYPDGNSVCLSVLDGSLLKESDLPGYDSSLFKGWKYLNTQMLYYESIPIYEDTVLELCPLE